MPASPLHWPDATMRWAPEVSPSTAILTVPTEMQRYATLIFEDELLPALRDLNQGEGDYRAHIEPAEYVESLGGLELGELVITAESLTERFAPDELRARLDELANQATLEGDAMAERDHKRAKEFLDRLAGDP